MWADGENKSNKGNTTQYNKANRSVGKPHSRSGSRPDRFHARLSRFHSRGQKRRWEPTAKLQSPSLSLSSPPLRNSTECNRIIGDRPTTETTRDSGIKLISGHAYWTTRRHDTWQRGESGRRLPLALLSGLEG
ncbi:uncharacterized protein UBRO_20888 [Ustilago bromivora]|uniref:Uncharacterized protein n=1 Tax=Ustilago bromivora TaxID=307758 RepID=A0A1K0HDK8_9BASI|nr:uncharacterized protein UBRO_20888 [Ustilago bromivora]